MGDEEKGEEIVESSRERHGMSSTRSASSSSSQLGFRLLRLRDFVNGGVEMGEVEKYKSKCMETPQLYEIMKQTPMFNF